MSLTLDTPILGRREVDQDVILHNLFGPDSNDEESLVAIKKYARVAGIDPAVADGMALLETDNFTSPRYLRDKALAGVGITSNSTTQPFVLRNYDESARLFIQCLYSLVTRKRHPNIPLDADVEQWFESVWMKKVRSPVMPNVVTVGDLGLRYVENSDPRATWSWEDGEAPMDAYGKKVVARLKDFYPNLPARSDGGSTVPPTTPIFDPEILKKRIKRISYNYVYKRREGQGFDYGQRGPIEGLFTHERQGRIGNSPAVGQKFFTCWTKESCDTYGICDDGERCADALVDWEILRDGTLVEYQDPYNTDRIPYASGGTVRNWSNPVGAYINENYPFVNDRFAATETEKTDNERLSPEQIDTIGWLGAYVVAKSGRKKREFWQLPDHAQAFSSTNCAMFSDDRAKFEALVDQRLADFWAGRMPEQTGGVTPAPDPTYAPAIPVPALDQYMNADPNTVPAVVTAEGSDWIFVNDVVRVVRDTPRLQRARPDALPVGGPVKKGEDFTAKFLVRATAGDWYYLTRYYTRIQVKDTTRSKDSV